MPDIVERILGEISATFDYWANTGEVLRCARGYESISVYGGSCDQRRAVKLLKEQGIRIGGIANAGAGRFCITVHERDKSRALEILKKKL